MNFNPKHLPWLRQTIILPETTSTNEYAWQMAESGASLPIVIFAEKQTNGRGQHGRRWHAAAGKGLWFSIALHPELTIQNSSRLTLAAATAVASTIRESLNIKALVKPPNDILIQGRKTAGILVETKSLSRFTAVIGIGLNVLHTQSDFSPEIQQTATSLQLETAQPIDRSSLAGQLLAALHTCLDKAYLNPQTLHENYKQLLDPTFELPKMC